MRLPAVAILLAYASFAAPPTLADEELAAVRKEIARCADVTSPLERVACYDMLAERLKLKRTEQVTATQSRWRVSVDQSKFDDSKRVVLLLDADEPVSIGRYKRSTPTMVVRCSENTTATYINFDEFLGSDDTSVEWRIDKQPVRRNDWSISTDHNAVGLWGGGSSIPFLKSLLDRQSLLIRLTPYSESPVSVSFTIAGLREPLVQLAESCGWKP